MLSSEVLHGDCLEILRKFPDNYFDSVVTDPPYALNFMGKEWDSFAGYVKRNGSPRALGDDGGRHDEGYRNMRGREPEYQSWCGRWAAECLRVLKPGGHLLAFGGTRTYHRLTCGLEDTGFEIRDSLHWIYGSGFPKSMDVSKAIDRAAGAEREITGTRSGGSAGSAGGILNMNSRDMIHGSARDTRIVDVTAPATEDAAQWNGWGTALKPAHEPIVVARKPLAGIVASNVLEWGTGGLNIDGCRVEGIKDVPASPRRAAQGPAYKDLSRDPGDGSGWDRNTGRFPPNILLTHSADCQPAGVQRIRGSSRADRFGPVDSPPSSCLSGGADGSLNRLQSPGYADTDGTETIQAWDCVPDCPVAGLDQQSGSLKSGSNNFKQRTASDQSGNTGPAYGAESRPAGSEMISYGDTGGASRFFPQFTWSLECDLPFMYCAKAPIRERPKVDGIAHPTIKPVALMRWLVRLVTPPGGTVLDPFAGTGTTAAACLDEGFRYVLIEREENYIRLINARLNRREPSLFEDA